MSGALTPGHHARLYPPLCRGTATHLGDAGLCGLNNCLTGGQCGAAPSGDVGMAHRVSSHHLRVHVIKGNAEHFGCHKRHRSAGASDIGTTREHGHVTV